MERTVSIISALWCCAVALAQDGFYKTIEDMEMDNRAMQCKIKDWTGGTISYTMRNGAGGSYILADHTYEAAITEHGVRVIFLEGKIYVVHAWGKICFVSLNGDLHRNYPNWTLAKREEGEPITMFMMKYGERSSLTECNMETLKLWMEDRVRIAQKLPDSVELLEAGVKEQAKHRGHIVKIIDRYNKSGHEGFSRH